MGINTTPGAMSEFLTANGTLPVTSNLYPPFAQQTAGSGCPVRDGQRRDHGSWRVGGGGVRQRVRRMELNLDAEDANPPNEPS